jgi:hypothetical protein
MAGESMFGALEDFLADWKSLAPRLEGIDLRLRRATINGMKTSKRN